MRRELTVSGPSLSSGETRPHHDCGAQNAKGSPDPISQVGQLSVYPPTPEHRQHDKYGSISGVNPSKRMLRGLEDGNDSIGRKQYEPHNSEQNWALFTQPNPNEVAATNLKEAGKYEKRYGAHPMNLPATRTPGKERTIRRFALRIGSRFFPRGTGGRSPSDDFPGAWYQAPCWPEPLTQHTESTKNKPYQRITMKQIEPQKLSTNKTNPHTTSLIFTLLAITLLTTACGTTGHRRKMMNEVLSQQNELLRQIELQRREPNVLRKVRRDETLWRAETTLREAIRAIRESNEAVKSAL